MGSGRSATCRLRTGTLPPLCSSPEGVVSARPPDRVRGVIRRVAGSQIGCFFDDYAEV